MEAAHNNAQAMKQFTPVVGEVVPVDQPEFRDTQNVQPVARNQSGTCPVKGQAQPECAIAVEATHTVGLIVATKTPFATNAANLVT